jgi:hypothetical protein
LHSAVHIEGEEVDVSWPLKSIDAIQKAAATQETNLPNQSHNLNHRELQGKQCHLQDYWTEEHGALKEEVRNKSEERCQKGNDKNMCSSYSRCRDSTQSDMKQAQMSINFTLKIMRSEVLWGKQATQDMKMVYLKDSYLIDRIGPRENAIDVIDSIWVQDASVVVNQLLIDFQINIDLVAVASSTL